MPKISERQRLIEDIDELLEKIMLDDDDNTEDLEDIFELKIFIESSRFISSRKTIPKNPSMNDMLWIWPEEAFKQEVRMGKVAFVRLVNLIESHEVFKNNSRYKQKAVWSLVV